MEHIFNQQEKRKGTCFLINLKERYICLAIDGKETCLLNLEAKQRKKIY